MTRWAVGIVIVVLLIAGAIYGIYQKNDYDFDPSKISYEVVQEWKLPSQLNEISAIAWLGNDKLACLQDEDGIIFMYDLKKSRIVSQMEFWNPGDYEALTIYNKHYWVAQSDGKLFRFPMNLESREQVERFDLKFEYRNNIEGIAAKKNGDILIAVKDRNLKGDEGDFKALYTFSTSRGKLEEEPTFKVNFKDTIFDVLKTNNPRMLLRPTDIEYHPVTGDLYIIDSEVPKILILGTNGNIKKMHLLDPERFFQPEGICFSPSGRIFISDEGNGFEPPNLIELKLK